ncbi:ornithine decarboxylase [Prauserella marina]|uniref:type III PLP-dependent enzyme n=1 Tax=Prauserella marina TaxID=530584 RepID=UPI000B8D4288|nr:type III PLP-dependent enzyme [Prauserella marina]ASR35413.1 ornithine decarboxylase [Prauserella marina]
MTAEHTAATGATSANRATARIREFLDRNPLPTPCLVVDLGSVADRYRALARDFAGYRVQYAVKANPSPAVLRALAAEGAHFDVASPAEIESCLHAGANPATLSYGNTIKKPGDIATAFAAGVRDFTVEAASDLDNVAEHAPGAEISVRLLVNADGAATPFGRKFGCDADTAIALLKRAARAGLDPKGVSFHVGSQHNDPAAWDGAMAAAAPVFAAAARTGIPLRALNVGGGIGTDYRGRAPEPATYAKAITEAVRTHVHDLPAELVIEPGRAIVAEAGLIRTEVVLVSRKSTMDSERWVYLDVGRYNGLAETENEAIAYRIEPVGSPGEATGERVIIAGPTCDGDDVLYQRTPYHLPLSLRAGDQLDILATGAYTASYSSVAFNGIPPLRTYCISEGRLISVE